MKYTYIYDITGMTCNGCRTNVENKLNEIPYIQAQVNLEKGQVQIQSDSPMEINVLQQKIEEMGGHYHVHPHGQGTTNTKSVEQADSPSQTYVCPMYCEGHEKTYDTKGRCPVCNMFLVPIESLGTTPAHLPHKPITVHAYNAGKYYCPMMCEGDKTYDHFGSCPVCGMNLEKIPETSIKVTFTCPMHPTVQSDKPGTCPICDMDLEPHQQDDPGDEVYDDWKRKLMISLLFTIPVFILSMGDMLPGNPISKIIPMHSNGWIQFALTLPLVFYTGWTFFVRGWKSFISWNLNMFSLIALGTTAAFLFSLVALCYPQLLPAEIKQHGHPPLYFESVVVIITLVILGQLMEAKAHSKTNNAIKELIKLTPSEAIRIVDGKEERIAVSEIKANDILRVRPGDKIPCDGLITEGYTAIDESMMTGESVPVEKKQGDHVIGGTINGNQSFLMQATLVGQDTVLSQIIQLVNQASRSQAPIQKLTDRVSRIFVPAVIGIALLTFVIWAYSDIENHLAYAMTNALSILIVACPCALGLATPMSVMVGIGKGAKHGILIKKAEALEQLQRIDVLILDKTGTITEGKPILSVHQGTEKFTADDVLQIAASLNKHSSHPLAQAMVDAAIKKEQTFIDVTNFSNIAGKGVAAQLFHMQVLLGNESLLIDSGISIPSVIQQQVHQLQSEGNSISYLAIDQVYAGFIAVKDKIKPYAPAIIQHVQKSGIQTIMLTGDNALTAATVASQVGIDHFQAKMLPEDKLKVIQDLQAQGKIVAMAGDGINDAPALTQAHVGIAMGSGTDVAIQSADITLLKGELKGVSKAIDLSRLMMTNIKQNLTFAFLYNVIGIPIAAGLLYPIWGILMSPMIAAAAMSLSSVSVIANSLRMNMKKL